MKIGIISDTHDQIGGITRAVASFNRARAGLVIHCGDLVSPFTLPLFGKLKCPMKALLGNNTGDLLRHMDVARRPGLQHIELSPAPFLSLEVEGRKIGVYHGDSPEITEALILSKRYDCVISGHNHVAAVGERDGVLCVNPGTLLEGHGPGMSEKPTIALYDTKAHRARLIRLA
jgi:putative phosphoesterase